MDDNFEKKIKELLPYIIINGVVFLLFPLLMSKDTGVSTYIIQLGVFPLTALGCGVFYKLKMKRSDLYLCAIAPLFYALTAVLYGMWHDWYNVVIYLAAYFICGYLGLMLGDLFTAGKKSADKGKVRRAVKKTSHRPRRVNVEEHHDDTVTFRAEDPAHDESLDSSTTEDDIEAILKSIHDRNA